MGIAIEITALNRRSALPLDNSSSSILGALLTALSRASSAKTEAELYQH